MIAAQATLLALLVVGDDRPGHQYPKTLEAETWVAQHELDCTEQLLPRPEQDLEVAGTHDLIVTIRAFGSCDIATQVSLLRKADGEVVAQVRYPEGGPISDQLLRLHNQHPGEPPKNLCSRIEMRSFGRTSKENRGLEAALRGFSELRVAPAPENVTYLEGQRAEIWATAGPSAYYFVIQGPRSESEGLNLLDSWSRAVLRTLAVDCASLTRR